MPAVAPLAQVTFGKLADEGALVKRVAAFTSPRSARFSMSVATAPKSMTMEL